MLTERAVKLKIIQKQATLHDKKKEIKYNDFSFKMK